MLIVSLLIAETGAGWIGRALAWRTPSNQVHALIQDQEESQPEFRTRVEQRLERLRKQGVWLEQVLLLDRRCSDGSSDCSQLLPLIIGRLGAGSRPASILLVPSAPGLVVDMPWQTLLLPQAGSGGTLAGDVSATQEAKAETDHLELI